MKFKKWILQYHYEKNSDGNSTIYAHRLHRSLAFLIDTFLLIILSALIGSILSIILVGPLIYRAQSRAVSGNVDFILYMGIIALCILAGFWIANIGISIYNEKHGYSIGQKIFSLQIYNSETKLALWWPSFIKELWFQIIFWLSIAFLLPFIILVAITLIYIVIKSSKKMWWDGKTYIWYNTTKNKHLLSYIPQ